MTTCENLPEWKRVWRRAIAPLLPPEGLDALRLAVEADDPALIQGATVGGLNWIEDPEAEPTCGCALGYALWQGDRLSTVRDVSEAFTRVLQGATMRLEFKTDTIPFFRFWDDLPRAEVLRLFLPEVVWATTELPAITAAELADAAEATKEQ